MEHASILNRFSFAIVHLKRISIFLVFRRINRFLVFKCSSIKNEKIFGI